MSRLPFQCGEQKVIGGQKHHSVSTTLSVLIIIIDNILLLSTFAR